MSDQELRALERAKKGDSDDLGLRRARVRSGLGWDGEALPKSGRLVPAEEPGVYVWRQPVKSKGLGIIAEIGMQLVHVPGGDVPCVHEPHEARRTEYGFRECRWCRPYDKDEKKRGLRPVPGFYIGRFPVRMLEWWAAEFPETMLAPDIAEHAEADLPVALVKTSDAEKFCAWAGLRLPTETEWRWAAIGGPDGGDECIREGCPRHPRGRKPWTFPWGNPAPMSAHAHYGASKKAPVLVLGHLRGHITNGLESGCSCVGERGRPKVPARPHGMSWCGALDMAGNVRELVRVEGGPVPSGSIEYATLGGGFKPTDLSEWAKLDRNREPAEDLGFRVALGEGDA